MEEVLESMLAKKFQVMVASRFGMFCYFEEGNPQIVYDPRDERFSKTKLYELGEELSNLWMGDVHLVTEGYFFLRG